MDRMDSDFQEFLDGAFSPDMSPEQRDALEEQLVMACEELQEALGDEYIAHLMAVLMGEEDDEMLRCYKEGCEMGIKLMQEKLDGQG